MKKKRIFIPVLGLLLAGIPLTLTSCGESGQTQTASKSLVSISIQTQPTKTTYTEGEYFDPTGMVVVAQYDDETSATITGYTCTNIPLSTSMTSITVTYQGKNATVPIVVNRMLTPKEKFMRAKTQTYENSIYEYSYEIEAKIKFAGAVSFSPANLSGVIQYDAGEKETQYMHKQDASGALLFDYTTYTYNVGNDLIKINANENKNFSVVNNLEIPNNYDFETNSVGFILKALADNDNLSVNKSGNKYNLALKTSFKSPFLSLLNKIDSKKIIDALSDITEDKWGVAFGCECYAILDSSEQHVSDFYFGVNVNVKDFVEIQLSFNQHFTKVGKDVKITLPQFENTFTTTSDVNNKLNEVSTAINNSKKDYYKYKLHTKVDHGVSKGNPLGLGVDSTSQGYAEREIIGDEVYFHNGLELDSDYKNKDQYPDDIEDYKYTRAKLNNDTKDVYDVIDGVFKNTFIQRENYSNDAIDDYYMLLKPEWITSNEVKILRKTTKSGKDTYRLGMTTDGIQNLLEEYNKYIRLDADEKLWIDVYDIASDFQPRKSEAEIVVNSGLVEKIDFAIKGYYVIDSGKQVKFEFDLTITFDHDHAAYSAPSQSKDITLPNY